MKLAESCVQNSFVVFVVVVLFPLLFLLKTKNAFSVVWQLSFKGQMEPND